MAYELRISDWSSDVCSSDLRRHICGIPELGHHIVERAKGVPEQRHDPHRPQVPRRFDNFGHVRLPLQKDYGKLSFFACPGNAVIRSEEHTSELQSLMRISYAVFCLNKTQSQSQILTL